MQIAPLNDNVVVELDKFEECFESSGIVRPDIAKEKPIWGTVIGHGPGRFTQKNAFIASELSRGDRVLVPWGTGHDGKIGNRTCVIIRERDIMAVEEHEG